jgi:hypothetical protein
MKSILLVIVLLSLSSVVFADGLDYVTGTMYVEDSSGTRLDHTANYTCFDGYWFPGIYGR